MAKEFFRKYRDVEITLDFHGQFVCEIDTVEIKRPTYDELVKKIDTYQAEKKKKDKKKIKVKILDIKGRGAVLTGIHGRLGKFTMNPDLHGSYNTVHEVYYECKGASDLVAKYLDLEKQLDLCKKSLEPFMIDCSNRYGSINEQRYKDLVQELEDRLKEIEEYLKKNPMFV